ncbi:unnamed protein product [Acanthoscelides obtectus]|uniref:Uncharacterized protein n=1 Tax=Acanthoscelides obtectus TaxID=200917 RepID=A0A9P0PUJ1_ACAOB|nr:unnamed protein product [Acanthoscelides obtectus]CAK1655745.1 hypothetical protein AOBTE_LOCUS19295 [Acanthoscelides obtectus]
MEENAADKFITALHNPINCNFVCRLCAIFYYVIFRPLLRFNFSINILFLLG